jgi:hypothetical protein
MKKRTKKRLTIEIEPSLHHQAKCKAYAENTNITVKVTELIKEWLRK